MAVTTLEHDIGAKLRMMRRMNKMRLKDVAEAVDCSESLLSKIENNKIEPSLKVLHRITAVLGTSIAELFAARHENAITVQHAGERTVVITRANAESGAVSLERIIPFGDDQLLDANIHIVDPKTDSGGDITHAGEEVGFVLDGELELTIEDETFYLKPGDSFYFRSELRHRYYNPGDHTTRVLWVNTPPTF
ncbi:MAG: XRE family transcriptional regulator [Kiloniellaceae bacterium]